MFLTLALRMIMKMLWMQNVFFFQYLVQQRQQQHRRGAPAGAGRGRRGRRGRRCGRAPGGRAGAERGGHAVLPVAGPAGRAQIRGGQHHHQGWIAVMAFLRQTKPRQNSGSIELG